MNRITVLFLVAFSPLCLVTSAIADTLHVVINSNFNGSFSKDSDSYQGWYVSTERGSTGTRVPANFDGTWQTTFQNTSFVLPAGSVVTSALESISYDPSSDPIYGTGYVYVASGRCMDPDLPCVAPTFEATVTSYLQLGSISWGPLNESGFPPGTSANAIVNGNTVSTGNMDILFYNLFGTVAGTVLTPGLNWQGYIGGVADITIPYTVTMDVQYTTPVPEPSAFVLSATGILGALGGIARRHFRKNT